MSFLTKKWGPFPVWLYMAGVLLAAGGYYFFFMRRPAGSVPNQPTPGNLGPISAGYSQAASAYGTGTGPIIVASPTAGNTGITDIGQQSPSLPQTSMIAKAVAGDGRAANSPIPIMTGPGGHTGQAGFIGNNAPIQITGPPQQGNGGFAAWDNNPYYWYPLGPGGTGPFIISLDTQFQTSGSAAGYSPLPIGMGSI